MQPWSETATMLMSSISAMPSSALSPFFGLLPCPFFDSHPNCRSVVVVVLFQSLCVQPSPRGELGGADIVPRGEIATWVEGWVSASKALTQWDVLADYARATDNLPLAMDCLWRLHDWEMLQGMLAQNQGQVWIMLEGSRRVGGGGCGCCLYLLCVCEEGGAVCASNACGAGATSALPCKSLLH